MMDIGMWDWNDEPIKVGDKVKLANGQIGEIVYERGAFGVFVQETIDYERIQEIMDDDY